uniref:Uncharacterized protein n=1 Tax=Tetranychus urticae TaxID=32264 RepID=T1JWM8_TETUR
MPDKTSLRVFFNLEIVLRGHGPPVDFNVILSNLNSILGRFGVHYARITDSLGSTHELGKRKRKRNWNARSGIEYMDLKKPLFWKGLVGLANNRLADFIRYVSSVSTNTTTSSFGYFWRFDDKRNHYFDRVIGVESNKTSNVFTIKKIRSTVDSFCFGSLVNGNRFVRHLDSLNFAGDDNFIYNIIIRWCHLNNQLILEFVYRSGPTLEKYRLVYPYSALRSVKAQQEDEKNILLYLCLANAPKIYLKKKCLNEVTGWVRWYNGCPMPVDVIGKCNTLKLDLRDLDPSYLQNLFQYHKHYRFDLSFGLVHVYNLLGVDRFFPTNFPRPIKYAIECVKSLGFDFSDDLWINHHGEGVFNEIIANQINRGNGDQVVMALYCLFDMYLSHTIYDAIECFKFLLRKVGKRWNQIQLPRDTDDIVFVKTAIITPTRVIFTPPSFMTKSDFQNDVDLDSKIVILFNLDENFPTKPWTGSFPICYSPIDPTAKSSMLLRIDTHAMPILDIINA